MGERIKNLKALFSDAKARLVILSTFAVIILISVVGFWRLNHHITGSQADSSLARAPDVPSVPGSENQSPEYIKLQERENTEGARQALASGDSFVPTIVQSAYFDATGFDGDGQGTQVAANDQSGRNGQGNGADGQGANGQGLNGQGNGTDGQGANGQGLNGQGNGTDGQGADGQGLNGQGNGTDGQGADGQGLNGQGNGTDGQGANGQGLNGQGNGTDGQGANGQGLNGQGSGVDGQGANGQGLNGQGLDGQGNINDLTAGRPLAGSAFGDSQDSDNPFATSDQRLQDALQRQQEMMSAQDRDQALQAMKGRMNGQAQALFTAWGNSPTQQYVQGQEDQSAVGAGGPGGAGAQAGSGANGAAPIIKAGDVMFAVLITSVNSDEPGPVMAKIVSGKYKGAKLIGSLTQNDDPTRGQEAVILRFNRMSVPDKASTMQIESVAIDGDTARLGLATDVNRHILYRYGSLFAAAFMQGYGEAVMSEDMLCLQWGESGCLQYKRATPLNSEDKIFTGLGQVGKSFGDAMKQNFNRKPTVKVASGTGIGILFMNDVSPDNENA